ncbi:uncharacterized protein VTP21DRAFT_8564 [Calcarisporiella thermophila]|uniref:uncharacterized protein n=1 Tax=Calcarisporiella thermophila TaxID=911321 RepID=UPI003741F7DE
MLNRTLIVPPANLGRAIPFRTFDFLKNGYDDCLSLRPSRPCKSITNKVFYVPFNKLLNFNAIEKKVRMIFLDDARADLNRMLDIKDEKTEVLMLHDATRKDYKIFDQYERNDQQRLKPYLIRLMAEDLRKHSAKLVRFGSLFGSERVTMNLPESKAMFDLIQETIVFSHPEVIAAAKRVVTLLGNEFVSVQARIGDGYYAVHERENLLELRDKLKKVIGRRKSKIKKEPPPLPAIGTRPNLEECKRNARYYGRWSLVFMATDSPESPHVRTTFRPIVEEFPCTFTLHDMSQDILKIHSDDIPSGRLMPMVDALIASYGRFFVFTGGSTYGRYVKRLNRLNALKDD